MLLGMNTGSELHTRLTLVKKTALVPWVWSYTQGEIFFFKKKNLQKKKYLSIHPVFLVFLSASTAAAAAAAT